jgi:hypothetical protein
MSQLQPHLHIEPFSIHIEDEVLANLRARIRDGPIRYLALAGSKAPTLST